MSKPIQPLAKPFSLYLDAVRFIAAALVVLDHYLQYGVVQGALAGAVPSMGRQAVVIFFVLSGFVIAYTTEQKQQSAADYITARCARIYSVALPVVLLSFAAAALATAVFGAQVGNAYEVTKAYIYLPFHLLFLGQLWTFSDTPPWLAPYWSLGYEVWYYVLFGVMFYLRGARRLVVGALVFALIGYKLWLLLPVWLSGVWLYHWQKTHRVPLAVARIGFVATLGLLVAYNLGGLEAHLRALGVALWPFPGKQLGSAERFLADYAACAIVLANFAFARFAGFERILRFANPIRTLASYTFTLYLAHGLVLGAWRTFRTPHGDPVDIFLVTAAIVLFTWSLGHITEGRKHRLHALFDGWSRAARSRLGLSAQPAAPVRPST